MFNDLKYFVTAIVVSLKYYHADASTLLLWVPHENLSWYSALNSSHNVTSAVKWRINDDSLYQNLLILNHDCLSCLKMGSGFWDSVEHFSPRVKMSTWI